MAWGQALLAWSSSFSSFGQVAAAQRFYGWSEATMGQPCSWQGIKCQDGLLSISLRYMGLAGASYASLMLL